MAVDVSIVIPTVGRPDMLVEVLRALEQQTCSFEVVVVCDGEHAATRALSATWRSSFPLKWVFSRQTGGHSSARNLGAEHAKGSILVFLDDDTVPAPGWLQAHRMHHSSTHVQCVVLGRLRHEYPDPPSSNIEQFMRDFTDKVQDNLESSLKRMDTESTRDLWVGLNTSVPKTLFTASGGFDIALRHAEEDAELATRILSFGAVFIYEPNAFICHHSTKDLVQLHLTRAAVFAAADLYRLRYKQQPVAKWPVMAAMYHDNGAQKLKHRLAWHLPRLASVIGELCRIGGEAFSTQFLLRQWRDLTFKTRYWGQIKAEGLSLRDVRRLLE